MARNHKKLLTSPYMCVDITVLDETENNTDGLSMLSANNDTLMTSFATC